jgi:hypothetical protein
MVPTTSEIHATLICDYKEITKERYAKISPNWVLCSYKFCDVSTSNIIHHRLNEISIMCHVYIFRLIGHF